MEKEASKAQASAQDSKEQIRRLAELITLFSRCRQERKVKDCEKCGLLHHDCQLKAQHGEYRTIERGGEVDILDAYPLLPTDVIEELGLRR